MAIGTRNKKYLNQFNSLNKNEFNSDMFTMGGEPRLATWFMAGSSRFGG